MVRLMLLGSSTTAHYVEPSLELQVESGKNWKGNHKRKSLQEDQHVKQGDRTKHMCVYIHTHICIVLLLLLLLLSRFSCV